MSEPFRIFVYCDDNSHSPKRVPVDVFLELPAGGWDERPPKGRVGRAGHVGLGMHMIGDAPAKTGWASDPAVSNDDLRTRFELLCERTPQCRRRPVPARKDHLFAVLDKWRALGVSEQSLAVLAANLHEQAKRRRPPG